MATARNSPRVIIRRSPPGLTGMTTTLRDHACEAWDRSGLGGVDDLLVALVHCFDDSVVVTLVDGLVDLLVRLGDRVVDAVEVQVVDDGHDGRRARGKPLRRVDPDLLLLVPFRQLPDTGSDAGADEAGEQQGRCEQADHEPADCTGCGSSADQTPAVLLDLDLACGVAVHDHGSHHGRVTKALDRLEVRRRRRGVIAVGGDQETYISFGHASALRRRWGCHPSPLPTLPSAGRPRKGSRAFGPSGSLVKGLVEPCPVLLHLLLQ